MALIITVLLFNYRSDESVAIEVSMEGGHTDSSSPEKFVKLKNFDFKNNKVFQDGWRKIKDVIPQEQMFESLVKAQVFFFSRYSIMG